MKQFEIKVQGVQQVHTVHVEAEGMTIDKECVILNNAEGYTIAVFPIERVMSAVQVPGEIKR